MTRWTQNSQFNINDNNCYEYDAVLMDFNSLQCRLGLLSHIFISDSNHIMSDSNSQWNAVYDSIHYTHNLQDAHSLCINAVSFFWILMLYVSSNAMVTYSLRHVCGGCTATLAPQTTRRTYVFYANRTATSRFLACHKVIASLVFLLTWH